MRTVLVVIFRRLHCFQPSWFGTRLWADGFFALQTLRLEFRRTKAQMCSLQQHLRSLRSSLWFACFRWWRLQSFKMESRVQEISTEIHRLIARGSITQIEAQKFRSRMRFAESRCQPPQIWCPWTSLFGFCGFSSGNSWYLLRAWLKTQNLWLGSHTGWQQLQFAFRFFVRAGRRTTLLAWRKKPERNK